MYESCHRYVKYIPTVRNLTAPQPERGWAMPKYVIERPLPGAGKLTAEELHGISAKSNQVLANLGPEVRWLQSFVTEDKIYCVYVAPDPELIMEHARCGGFPAQVVTMVSAVIHPSSVE